MRDEFGLIVRHTLRPGHEEAFDALVDATLPVITEREPGTLVYCSRAVAERAELRVFYELYRDRAAFEAHEEQPHVKRFLAEREQHVSSIEVDFLSLLGGKGSSLPR